MRPVPFLPPLAVLVLVAGLCGRAVAQEVAQEVAVVRGVVVDERGAGMPYVNVQLAGTVDGAATDEGGRFRFVTRRLGRQVVRATMIGYEPAEASVVLVAGDSVALRLVVREALVALGEAVVTASAYTTGEAATATLGSLEVVTTPGAAADILLAVKTFPGVATIDEGSGLFVRGGDVGETVILLDQATVVHPYKYESPTGGVFGTIPPFLVGGTHFSTGGFGARYGNALSGVLAMETLGRPDRRRVTANLGFAAASLGADLPLFGDRLGVRFSGNRSFTAALFRLNGRIDAFPIPPYGSDANLSVVYRYASGGQVKVFNFVTTDRLGVRVDEPSFSGVYRGETRSRLHNVQWTHAWRRWLVRAGASAGFYDAHRRLGSLDLRPADATYKVRADVEGALHERLRLEAGAEVEHAVNAFRGTVPAENGVVDPSAAVYRLDERFGATRTGAYAAVEVRAARRLVASLGLRADHHGLARTAVADPRVSVRYQLAEHTDLRLAWGLYHQFATPYQYNPASGNPGLGPQRAQHRIAGLTHERGLVTLRLEAYDKPYRRLVVEGPAGGFTNAGGGRARGVDAFARYGAFLRTRVSGWASYSYLRSERVQARHLGRTAVYERGPSPFDVTHNLTVVLKARLAGLLSGGLTFRHATGRPLTPVAGAVPGDGGTYFLPVEGPVGSERLPAYRRLDATLSYYLPFGRTHNAVFYLAVNNVLDRTNVLGYEYSADYAERHPRTTDYRRFVYAGASLTLNL